MEPEINANNQVEARFFKTQLARHAFNHLEEIDGRTGARLLRHGVLKHDPLLTEDETVIKILLDRAHPDRMSLPPGPIIGHYLEGKDRTQASYIPTIFLLLSQDRRAREGSLNHFLAIATSIGHLKPELLQDVLNQHKHDLLSNDIEKWTESAISLFDFITDDFFLNLAAFKQFIHLKHDAGLNEYFPKLLYPSLKSVEWIELPVATPTGQNAKIEGIIEASVADSNSFIEACDHYYRRVGTLPLHPALSLAKVLEKWNASKGTVEDVWRGVWSWADKIASPVARYHAANLFCTRIDLIPNADLGNLWNEILQIIIPSKSRDEKVPWIQEWMLRCELAQHYLKYFESQRPGRNSEAMASFAWWLSEQVSLVFSSQTKLIDEVRSSALKPAITKLNYLWQTCNPSVEPSAFRYLTLFTHSVWSLSLQCVMSKNLPGLRFNELRSEQRFQFEQAVAESLYSWFPVPANSETATTFAFDAGVGETCKVLAEIVVEPERANDLKGLIAGLASITTTDQIISGLSHVFEIEEPFRALAAMAFRVRANLNAIPLEEVWKVLSDEKWRREVFLKLPDGPLQVLFDAFNTMQPRGGELWRCNLPHFFALAAETCEHNRDRQKLLFLFAILSSVGGDTVSAIQRVLKGQRRKDFVGDVKFWQDQFTRIIQISPPWVAARIRPVLASLST